MSNSGQTPTPTITHWAILIGVGKYVYADTTSERQDSQSENSPTGIIDRSLKGAVADVVAVENYLKAQPHVRITTLSIERPDPQASSQEANQDPETLPTQDNVRNALRNVNTEGPLIGVKHVYIHFSGHGSRIGDNEPLALALYHPGHHGTSYLRGSELASALKRMVDQGMYVTLVLDCCFSGSVQRTSRLHGDTIRFIEYNPALDSEPDYTNPFAEWDTGTVRNATYSVNRILDAKGYTVITACSPTENASEIEIEGEGRRGALSYFLEDTLKMLQRVCTQITHATLYSQLQSRVHARLPQQTPMRYGSTEFCFFESIIGNTGERFVTVTYDKEKDVLVLNAGEAHGVSEGDEYEAYPYYEPEDKREKPKWQPMLVKVLKVQSLTSKLLAVDSEQGCRLKKIRSWKARPVMSIHAQKTGVGLLASIPKEMTEQLEESVRTHHFMEFYREENGSFGTCSYIVGASPEKGFEIHDSYSAVIPGLPKIPYGGEDGLKSLINTLDHLAKFKFFESFENSRPDPHFCNSFSFKVNHHIKDDGWYQVNQGTNWELTVTNTGSDPLYIAIFNFRPSYEICNMAAEACEGEYFQVPPEGPTISNDIKLILEMEVPEFIKAAGTIQSEDIVKMFVTSKPTSFPRMLLPPLIGAESCGDGGGDTRNNGGNANALSLFIENFRGSFTGSTRDKDQGHWVTQNFLIRTCI
ncbi:Metacaspase-1B [Arthrobotrys entomopaga]|nr:Metacaspase-1B [Arthrobotrys entomopaga]